jgi:formylglycine-generating enzyme required for sulfatase activity
MSRALLRPAFPEEFAPVTHAPLVNVPPAARRLESSVHPLARTRLRQSRSLWLAGLLVATLGVARSAAPAANSLTIDVGGVPMEFVLVRAGSFLMGSAESVGVDDESPARRVTITRDFYLGKFEVTQAQWEKVMATNPSRFRGSNRPVETVSWNDCQIFLAKLAAATGRRFALPTEAQWEFACRAGTTSRWSFGDEESQLSDYAWSGVNAGGETHPVGTRRPNPAGLYDMHGNVGEWTADGYEKHLAFRGATVDPQQPLSAGHSPVWRGGAWGDNPDFLRSGYRNVSGVDTAQAGIGLRCVLLATETAAAATGPATPGPLVR